MLNFVVYKKSCTFIKEMYVHMKTKYFIPVYSIIIYLLLSSLCLSCGNFSTSNDTSYNDTVAVEIIKKNDSTSYIKSDGQKCDVYAEATISVPTSCGSKDITVIRQLFAKYLLDAADTISVDEALNQYVSNYLKQYEISYNSVDVEDNEDESDIDNVKTYNNSINISVYFNNYNIVTFSKTEVIKKDGQVSSVTHKYYNIDLETNSLITLGSLFRDDASSALCQDLKASLMAENKVASADELNEVGYFNIDNMTVPRNFFFDKEGITWVYLPNELAIEALGEPRIKLSYDILEPYMSDKSAIIRFLK